MKPEDVPESVRRVCARLVSAGKEAFVVGGCVRDTLWGRSPKDWDVATSAVPDEVTRLFRRTIPTGIQHGTVTVLEDGAQVEVTTFRGEGAYSDARRPDFVAFGVPLTEDLGRRDFTVNAMAYDPVHDRLVDPFGGQEDLRRRLIRAVGHADARFREDGLRTMRAVRFVATLEFDLDPATEAAIPDAASSLRRVSAERIRDELLKLLAAPRPSRGLEAMRRTYVLAVVLPELAETVSQAQNRFHAHDVWTHTLLTVDETVGDPVRRLGALLHDVAKPRTAQAKPDAPGDFTFFRHEAVGAGVADSICRRLRLSNRERERVVGMVAHHMFWYTPQWRDATVRRFVASVGEALLQDLFALRAGDVVARGRGEDPEAELGELRARIDKVLREAQALKVADLAIDGNDIMQILGLPPGRRIGEILRALLERVIEDPALNERDRLRALLPEVSRDAV